MKMMDPNWGRPQKRLREKWLASRILGMTQPKVEEMLKENKDWMARRDLARQIDPDRLPEMMKDEDQWVRYWVARRIDPSRLHEMMEDPSWMVRQEVAERIPSNYLSPMLLQEGDSRVIGRVKRRLDHYTWLALYS